MAKEQAVNLASTTSVGAAHALPAQRRIAWLDAIQASLSPWQLVATAMFVGAMLRIWRLDELGYNSDEAVYAGQAAAFVNDANISPYFPLVRAHPMLFQFTLAMTFHYGVTDIVGRLVSVLFGVATLLLVFLVGRTLYDAWTGAVATLLLALMPYHVVVSRQVLLDGPMTFFATLTLLLIAKYAATHSSRWLWAAAAGMGMTFLAKETGVVLVASVYAFLALCMSIPIRLRDVIISSFILATVVISFPVSLLLAGGGASEKAQGYLVWQLLRKPNHVWSFYPSTVPIAMGVLVVAAAVAGLWFLRRQHSWRENLLLAWIAVPVIFFQLWPVKGFQYLLPTAPCVVLLASRALRHWSLPAYASGWRQVVSRVFPAITVTVLALSLAAPAWSRVETVPSDRLLAGSGGMPGGRETGDWIRQYVPEGAVFLCIGPSMANVVQFYGHRKAYGLSVSPNPLTRNPSYDPILNADRSIRTGEVQYLVYDVYSASRSAHFGDRILDFAERYHGTIVHVAYVTITDENGARQRTPVIIIFEVRP